MIIDQLPTVSLPVQDTDELPVERGTQTYKISVGNSFVKKSGDAMTGDLMIVKSGEPVLTTKNNLANISQSTEASSRSWIIANRDVNNLYASYWQTQHLVDGTVRSIIAARSYGTGTNIDNALYLSVAPDGTQGIALTAPSAWRYALGFGSSGELPITVGQGGTGQTATTSTSTVSQIATAGTGFSIANGSYSYWGKLAMLNLTITRTGASVTSNTTMILGTLVSGKRPVIRAPMVTITGSVLVSYIDANGTIAAYGTWAQNGSYSVTATYLLA